MKEHTNLLDFDGNCVMQCPTVAGKDVGISIATNPPTCLICHKDTLNEEFYPSLDNVGGCDCEPNRYINVGVCTPCTNDLCRICSNAAPATCIACIDNSVLADSSDQTSGCNCVDGFFKASDTDYTKCLACPTGCATCTSATTCLTCVTATTRQGTDNQCACIAGYFEAGNIECEKCPLECQECESATKCTACDATKKFVAKDDACVC